MPYKVTRRNGETDVWRRAPAQDAWDADPYGPDLVACEWFDPPPPPRRAYRVEWEDGTTETWDDPPNLWPWWRPDNPVVKVERIEVEV